MRWYELVLIVCLVCGLPLAVLAADPLVVADFSADLNSWDTKDFKTGNRYEIQTSADGNRVLHAISHNSATGLIRKIEFDLHQYPVLSWRWKVAHTLEKGDAHRKSGDDYAARIYVIFPHWIKPLTRTINYIWANRLPVNEAIPNSYFSRAMMLAVESGDAKAGRWVTEQRNLLADYRRLFGEEPSLAGGIAIMTDTDNTGESVEAWYDDIVLHPAD